MLIPNVKELENSLQQFANILYLIAKGNIIEINRFEKFPTLLNSLLSCSKLAAQFQSMEVRNWHLPLILICLIVIHMSWFVRAILKYHPVSHLLISEMPEKHFEKLEKVSSSASTLG
ncbi:hypothetical protein NQ317_002331, partial [Molorchus minor]